VVLTGSPRPGPRPSANVRRAGRAELALLAALAGLAVAPLAGLLLRVALRGGHFTGGDGLLVLDQLQYLNWLRQASEHVLVGNLYDLAPGPRSFLHPGVAISGALHALGLGIAAAYLVWKPVAVLALWAGVVAWCHRLLQPGGGRLAAIALALFFASPVAALVGWTGLGGEGVKLDFDFLGGELTSGNFLWGYSFTAIAVGLVPLGLLAHERARTGWAAAAGLVAAWLQPWQGATFLLTLLATEAVLWRRRGRSPALGRLAVVACAAVAPLVYYLALSHLDAAWRLAARANDLGAWPWWVTVIGLAPLAVPAAFGVTRAPDDFAGWALRLWPLAALFVFVAPVGTFPAHAFQGLTLPLAVLAVLGVGHAVRGVAAWALIALLVVPGTLYRVDQIRSAVNVGRQPFFLEDGEYDALRWLDRAPQAGGVLAPIYTGLLVPAWTGRETWVGAGSWTPDFDARVQRAERLFSGRAGRAEAEAVVRGSGARFVMSDCHGRADIERLLAGVTGPPRRFGCATVWQVRR
jgi:hypothetical protein